MAVVFVPSLLRDLTGGRDAVTAAGATVAEVVENLDFQYPGFKARLVQDHALRPGLAVAVDGQITPLGLMHVVAESSEVHFVPAISGGEQGNSSGNALV